jgi:hypothetical protein
MFNIYYKPKRNLANLIGTLNYFLSVSSWEKGDVTLASINNLINNNLRLILYKQGTMTLLHE